MLLSEATCLSDGQAVIHVLLLLVSSPVNSALERRGSLNNLMKAGTSVTTVLHKVLLETATFVHFINLIF